MIRTQIHFCEIAQSVHIDGDRAGHPIIGQRKHVQTLGQSVRVRNRAVQFVIVQIKRFQIDQISHVRNFAAYLILLQADILQTRGKQGRINRSAQLISVQIKALQTCQFA